VQFRGKAGVVEAVDLTPGMVDVRYGRLVKRHSASDLSHAARANTGRRRPKRGRGRRARWNPGADEAHEAAQAALTAAQEEKRAAEKAHRRSLKEEQRFREYGSWKRLYDEAQSRPALPAKLKQVAAQLQAIEREQGPLRREDAERFFAEAGVLEDHIRWVALSDAWKGAPAMAQRRKELIEQLSLASSATDRELAEAIRVTEKGARDRLAVALGEVQAVQKVAEQAAALAETEAATVKEQKAAEREAKKKEPKPPAPEPTEAEIAAADAADKHARRLAADERKEGRDRRREVLSSESARWEKRRERELGTSEPGTTEHGARSGEREAAALLSSDHAAVERSGAVNFFVLPDPPRFEREWRTPSKYFGELCGNPIDGSIYVLRLSGQKVLGRKLITDKVWAKLKRSYTSRGKRWPEPGDYDGVAAILTRILKADGYTQVTPRGRRQEAQPDATQKKRRIYFTAADVRRMKAGDIIEAVPTRGQRGRYSSQDIGVDLRTRDANLTAAYAAAKKVAKTPILKRFTAMQAMERVSFLIAGVEVLRSAESSESSPLARHDFSGISSTMKFAQAAMQATGTKSLEAATAAVWAEAASYNLTDDLRRHQRQVLARMDHTLPLPLYARLVDAQSNQAEFKAALSAATRREKQLLASIKTQRDEVKEKVAAAEAGRPPVGVKVERALSSAAVRQRRAKKAWGARTVDVTGRSSAATKTQSGKMFSEYQLPADTFFYEVPGEGFLAFTAWRQVPTVMERLSSLFSPPFDPNSNKAHDPFFTWQPMRRPLSTTTRVRNKATGAVETVPADPFATAPRCTTSQYNEILEIARELRSPIYTMGSNLRWLEKTIQSGGDGKPLASLIKAGDSALRTSAWFASWMQDVAVSLARVPKALSAEVPERRVLASIRQSPTEPDGLPLVPLVKAAAQGPVALVMQDKGSVARVIGGDELVGVVPGIDANLPERFTWRPFTEDHFSWQRLQQDEARAKKDNNQGLLEQVRARMSQTFLGQLNREVMKLQLQLSVGRSKPIDGGTALATLIVTKQVGSGLLPKAAAGSAISRLVGTIRALSLFPGSGPDREEMERRQGATKDTAQHLSTAEMADLKEDERRHKILQGLFFIYQVMGGAHTQRLLQAAQQTLGIVAENAGRLPPAGHTGKRLTLLEAREGLDRADPRDPKGYGLAAGVRKAAQSSVHADQYGQAMAKHLNRGDRLYYTFNPVLFKLTKQWWNYGTPWARVDGTLTPEAIGYLQDVDRVGRYGVALRIMYEAARKGANPKKLKKKIRNVLGDDRFFNSLHGHLQSLDRSQSDDSLGIQYKAIALAGQQLLYESDPELVEAGHAYPALEKLTPWVGGSPLLHRLPDGRTGGWLVELSNKKPKELTTGVSGFAEDPGTYLSGLRRGAKDALLATTRAANTLSLREERRVKRAQAAQDKIEAKLGKAHAPKIVPRSTDPIPPLPVPVTAPYRQPTRWVAGSTPTRFPANSPLAALEHVARDSERLRSLIQQRLEQLTGAHKPDDS